TRLVIAVVVMTVSDIIFDLLNVLVFHGGMLGMGIASSLSYYLAFIIGIGYFVKKDCIFKFSKKLVKLKSCKNMLKAGIPTIINMISTVLLSFTMNKILLGVSGSTAVAAYSVIGTVVNICYAFSGGLAGVALMLAGMYYCEEDRKSLKELLKVALRYAIIVDAIVTVIVFAVAPLLVSLFLTDNDLAIQMATQGSRIFVLSLVISAINSALKHFYQGTGRIKITYVLCALQNYICIALSAFVLSRVVGLDGVWFGYLCGEIIVLMVIFAYIVANRHKFDFSMDTLSLLPDGYGVPDDDCLILNIKNEAEVVEASQAAGQYCRAHNKSSRLCMYTGLCIEEMCNNIITYGFDKTGKNTINIRIFCKEDELVIRFRDDCKAFDPVKYFEMHNESDDPAHHIGIRMIFKLVKDVNYTNSMSLNNLTMKI
ncbi:MAG: MATE family efflux transporter, partial [Lachnospiraceae bacterium]